MKVTSTYILATVFALLFMGCQDRFRYPCQDPKNWDKEECKPPLCTATGTCPSQLTKPEEPTKESK